MAEIRPFCGIRYAGEALGRDVRALKTMLQAVLSLIVTTGEGLMLPGAGTIIVLMVGVALYLRYVHRRSSVHAVFAL